MSEPSRKRRLRYKTSKNITEAINTALEKDLDPEDSKWDDLSFAIESEQRVLDGYRDALHSSESGESLWKINEDLLDVDSGEIINLPHSFVEDFLASGRNSDR